MKPTRALKLSVLLAMAAALPAARAEDSRPQPADRVGEHPAVLVARRGVQPDPNANFYLHPARLSWSLERPLSEGEHPAVLVAHRHSAPKIDPNRFIVAHPARGSLSSKMQRD